MRNARREFIEKVMSEGTVKCAVIRCRGTQVSLEPDYSKDDFQTFLAALDLEYDNGYGGQELFGIVWMTDGTWFTRGEYDGAEWWEYHKCPEIPADWTDDRALAGVTGDYYYNDDDEDGEEDVE